MIDDDLLMLVQNENVCVCACVCLCQESKEIRSKMAIAETTSHRQRAMRMLLFILSRVIIASAVIVNNNILYALLDRDRTRRLCVNK